MALFKEIYLLQKCRPQAVILQGDGVGRDLADRAYKEIAFTTSQFDSARQTRRKPVTVRAST